MKLSRQTILRTFGNNAKFCYVSILLSVGWFGHIRYATPIVHTDDHKHLAGQAIDWLLKTHRLAKASDLAKHRHKIETGCGMLDLDENEHQRTPGRLEWQYSHMYDPFTGRGGEIDHTINALDEFVDWWERSLTHECIGNSSKAYRFLGYCCHLLQDMAVPSHTFCCEHGLRTRTADNLELLSRSKHFYLREPAGPPYPGDPEMHIGIFNAMAFESRGREPFDEEDPNEIAGILEKYYTRPEWTSDSWKGSYIGEFYYPYHRLMPSSPRIELPDFIECAITS